MLNFSANFAAVLCVLCGYKLFACLLNRGVRKRKAAELAEKNQIEALLQRSR
jgi:hypothetical protein